VHRDPVAPPTPGAVAEISPASKLAAEGGDGRTESIAAALVAFDSARGVEPGQADPDVVGFDSKLKH